MTVNDGAAAAAGAGAAAAGAADAAGSESGSEPLSPVKAARECVNDDDEGWCLPRRWLRFCSHRLALPEEDGIYDGAIGLEVGTVDQKRVADSSGGREEAIEEALAQQRQDSIGVHCATGATWRGMTEEADAETKSNNTGSGQSTTNPKEEENLDEEEDEETDDEYAAEQRRLDAASGLKDKKTTSRKKKADGGVEATATPKKKAKTADKQGRGQATAAAGQPTATAAQPSSTQPALQQAQGQIDSEKMMNEKNQR